MTRHKAGWNITKCLACQAKRHDNLLGNLRRREFAASPIDTATPQENQRLETRDVGASKRAFRARLPPILTLSTCYQTGWNVTKCFACHAKPHDNLLGNLRKGEVLQLPPYRHGDATGKPETRDVGASKRAFRARLPPIFTLCNFKIDVFLQVFVGTSKIATSKSMFRARLPSIFSTSHKMPRLPRNLHLVAT